MFTHYHPKGKKRNIREHLKEWRARGQVDTASIYLTIVTRRYRKWLKNPLKWNTDRSQQIDKKYFHFESLSNLDDDVHFKTPANGEFYRSRSKRRIRPNEELSETEDDVTEDWLMIKHEEVTTHTLTFLTSDSGRFHRLYTKRNPIHETLGSFRESEINLKEINISRNLSSVSPILTKT